MHAIGYALAMAGSMTWQITSALILGFALAAVIQALVPNMRVELIFGGLGLVPSRASARVAVTGVTWNYTSWLNVAFLLLAGLLVVRLLRSGRLAMLRMMGGPPDGEHGGPAAHQHDAGPCQRAAPRLAIMKLLAIGKNLAVGARIEVAAWVDCRRQGVLTLRGLTLGSDALGGGAAAAACARAPRR